MSLKARARSPSSWRAVDAGSVVVQVARRHRRVPGDERLDRAAAPAAGSATTAAGCSRAIAAAASSGHAPLVGGDLAVDARRATASRRARPARCRRGAWAWQAASEQPGSFWIGLIDAEHAVPVGGRDRCASAPASRSCSQRPARGVAGVAGLGALVDASGRSRLASEENMMRPCLVEQPHLLDPLLPADGDDLPVQAVAPVLEHVVVGAALDRLAELVGAARRAAATSAAAMGAQRRAPPCAPIVERGHERRRRAIS